MRDLTTFIKFVQDQLERAKSVIPKMEKNGELLKEISDGLKNESSQDLSEENSIPAESCEIREIEHQNFDLKLADETTDVELTTAAEPKSLDPEPFPFVIPVATPIQTSLDLSSKLYGGQGGKSFDHGHSHGGIGSLSINYGALVDGIIVIYKDQVTRSFGGHGGSRENIHLRPNEHISSIRVRYSRTIVQCLTFYTNHGRQLGPCGGKGSIFLICDRGARKEELVKAPPGFILKGLKGRAGDFLDAIGFNWGLVNL